MPKSGNIACITFFHPDNVQNKNCKPNLVFFFGNMSIGNVRGVFCSI
jgi:hypothetical protein